MSEAVFSLSAYPGVDIRVTRAPFYGTATQTTDSGKEIRCHRWGPRFRYSVSMNVLRTAGTSEVAALLAFIETHRGPWDSFLFTDPYDATQRRCRFDMDEFELSQIVTGAWECRTLRLVSVL